jgi:SAM-dependent methyltransferase
METAQRIRSLLLDPRLRGVDIDSPEALELHRQITCEKPLMRAVFKRFYEVCVGLARIHLKSSGRQVEIGAGGTFFKEYYPDVVTTDVKPSQHLDMVIDAQDMPFGRSTISVIYGINCFHHLPAPRRFFRELSRVLKPGGGCILVEPSNTWLSRCVHSNVHAHEHFDHDQVDWEAGTQMLGPLSGANQALSYIVFDRDRQRFEQEFPSLEICATVPMTNYLSYILAGGVNFRQLVPNGAKDLLRGLELVLTPASGLLAIHHAVVLRRIAR